jgi:hypothetical protein
MRHCQPPLQSSNAGAVAQLCQACDQIEAVGCISARNSCSRAGPVLLNHHARAPIVQHASARALKMASFMCEALAAVTSCAQGGYAMVTVVRECTAASSTGALT